MTTLAIGVRDLSLDEIVEVTGAPILPILGLMVGAAGVFVAVNMWAMQRGRNDHAIHCKDH